MALDEQRDGDNVYTKDGITFVMNIELLNDAKPVVVDFMESDYGSGYAISSNLPKGGACGGSCTVC